MTRPTTKRINLDVDLIVIDVAEGVGKDIRRKRKNVLELALKEWAEHKEIMEDKI